MMTQDQKIIRTKVGLLAAALIQCLTATDAGGLSLTESFALMVEPSGRVFYVDPAGSDNNDGMSPDTAWATVSKVNSQQFLPGDVIAFKRGGVWHETLHLSSSGEAGNLIEVTAYGTGDAPVFDAEHSKSFAILVTTDYVRYSHLHATNAFWDNIRIKDATGGELVNVEASFSMATGVRFMGLSTTGWVVLGGVSHDAGVNTNEDPVGYHFQNGAHDNLLNGVETYNNRGDGIQWGPTAGDNNNVTNAYLHDDWENSIDVKAGSQTVMNSLLTHSVQDVIIAHQNAVQLTLINNVISDAPRLLLALDNVAIVSSDNLWQNSTGSDTAVKLWGISGTFIGDVFFEDNPVNQQTMDLRNGGGSFIFENNVFYRFGGNYVIREPEGGSLTVKNSAFLFSGGQAIAYSDNTQVDIDFNSYLRLDSIEDWITVLGSSPRSYDKNDLEGLPSLIASVEGTDANSETSFRGFEGDGSFQPIKQAVGGSGSDTLTGTDGVDMISGRAGDDSLAGGGGDDVLFGGAGADTLIGGPGNDLIVGGAGSDIIDVSEGNDYIRYESFLDGSDQITGFSSGDIINLDSLFDSLSIATGERADRISLVDNGTAQEIRVDDVLLATVEVIDNQALEIGQVSGDILLGSF